MGQTLRRVTATLLVSAVVLAVPASASAAGLSDKKRAGRAVAYLASKQQGNGAIVAFSPIGSTSDAVLAFVAARKGRAPMKKALTYLSNQVSAGNVDSIGLQAKVVMAVEAAGRDARNFGGQNLVQAITSQLGGNGRYGDAVVFDDALAVLALEAAGVNPPASAENWLLGAQCPDGGWSYDAPYQPGSDNAHCDDGSPSDFFTSDSNTTSYVVQALEEAGATAWSHDPFPFFGGVRDPVHHGWAYSDSFVATDANSTALVLQAYRSADRAIPSGGRQALRDLQYNACGALAYDWNGNQKGSPNVGATIGAVPALLLKTFPVTGKVAKGIPNTPAC